MREIDLAVAWEWPMDAGFVYRLLAKAGSAGQTALAIRPDNLESALADLAALRLRVRNLLDRASDVWPEFARLASLAERSGTRIINHAHIQCRAGDKARNHLLCASHGIPVPFTSILAPFNDDPFPRDLPAALGHTFVAKPASGGGGLGVVLDTRTTQDVQNARRMYPHDRYLLQQRVTPCTLGGRRAWFRVFYVCGLAIPCWWDDVTHIYAPLSPGEEARHGLAGLRSIVCKIGQLTALDFFTTEIVLGDDGRLVCVDYANSPCDMRLQSQHADGVPDAVVERIIDGLLSRCLPPAPHPLPDWPIIGRTEA